MMETNSSKNTHQDAYQTVFKNECYAIADWWLEHAIDSDNGGFYGAISFDNTPDKTAEKSIILNARILWFLSEAAQFVQGCDDGRKQAYSAGAHRVYQYVVDRFVDSENGGVLWLLDAKGKVVDGRKHTYAQGFAIYAFSAYYDLTGNQQAIDLAMQCFELIELHAKDNEFGGHFEARSQTWGHLEDIRLSEKEDNSPKTMNTNLHVLEAYTGLHNTIVSHAGTVSSAQEDKVRTALAASLQVLCDHVVNMETGHTNMFMSEAWQDHSRRFSFGHDIESSWLIYKAIKSLHGTKDAADHYMAQVRRLGEVAANDGLRDNGSMADEYEFENKVFCDNSWWVQAEAMVGLATMWSIGEGEGYKVSALKVWQYVQDNFMDHENGEWFWFSKQDQAPEESEYKVGPWKGPYHTGRAMMQMHHLFANE